jgi:type II secretory pathway pseudopilin PulG
MKLRLARCRAAFTLLEAIVSLSILLVGIVMILVLFPRFLISARDAEHETKAVMLAQMKAEEIRRDDDTSNTLVNAIRNLPSPTAPVEFTQDPELAYQFSGTSLLYGGVTPEGDPGVARVIIRYSPNFRQSTSPNKDVLYELRFGP